MPPHPTNWTSSKELHVTATWLEIECATFPHTPQKSDFGWRNLCWQSSMNQSAALVVSSAPFPSCLQLPLKNKKLLKNHYAQKGRWLLPFTFHPQAMLFNISTVAVWESSTISICYTFLPSAGKTINWMRRTGLFKLISQSIVKITVFLYTVFLQKPHKNNKKNLISY